VVQNTRAPLRPARLRPLNTPQALLVETDASGRPVAVVRRGRRLPVLEVQDEWRIDDEWWRPRPISRLYFSVILEGGRSLVCFRDLIAGTWHEQRDG
jgi:hypothetical protein